MRGAFGTLALLLYVVCNHPLLHKSPFLQCIYYALMIVTASCELLSFIPSTNHHRYFRKVDGETCIIGIIILPAVCASFSMMWHINYLSFSILSLVLYLSFNFTHRYMLRVAYLTILALICGVIYPQYTILSEKPLTFLLLIYHIISLSTFERIFHGICVCFSNTFTFSDTVVVSGFIYFVFEQCVVITIACFVPQINYFQHRLQIHEYHIISICIIGSAIITAVTAYPLVVRRFNDRQNIAHGLVHLLMFITLILALFLWMNFILRTRCVSYPDICHHENVLSAMLSAVVERYHLWILLYWIAVLLLFFGLSPTRIF